MNDRASIPSWLTKKYLENILRKKNPKINVKSFTAVPPVAAGNNYASLILRTEAICKENGSEKVHSLIIKTVHFNEGTAELMAEFGLHANEMKMYSKHLPRMQALLGSIGDSEKLAPAAIFVDEKYKALIFEDLKPLDYKMADRKVGLDWDHVKVIARKLAKFHACSVILAEQGEEFKEFQKGLMNEEVHGFDPFFVKMCKELGMVLKSNSSDYFSYGEKLEKVSELLVEQGVEIFRRKPGQTLVLNHGDCWTANMLFKYDKNGQINNAALIDFQLGFFSSPVFDLMYFFYTSTNDEIKFNPLKFHELLKLYHQDLTKNLVALKSTTKPPTLFELHQEFYERNFAVILFISIFTIMINENEKDANMQMLLGDTAESVEYRKQLFLNPRAMKTIKHFLPIWDAQGLLDPLKH